MKEFGEYYAPSVARTIAAGETQTFEYRGLSGGLFAANRFLASAQNPEALKEITVTAKTNQGRDTWFENVQLMSLKRLFENRSFAGGIVIEENKSLELQVTNKSDESQYISITLNGYDQPEYLDKIAEYEEKGRSLPVPQFSYGSAIVAAGADQQRIVMSLPTADTELARIAISSTGENNMIVSFNVDNQRIFPERFVDSLNDEFRMKSIIEPVLLKKNLQFEAFVSNIGAVNQDEVSIIAETYQV
ncbi:MAG: hypothetical protein WEA58_04000 [Balneolaceae bacterium]